MIKFKKEMKLTDTVDYVECDICHKQYSMNNGYEDEFEIQEFLNIDFIGGYASVFEDGTHVTGNICQHCLKKILGQYLTYDFESDNYNEGSE